MKPILNIACTTISVTLAVCSCSKGSGEGRIWGSLNIPSCGVETDDYDMGVKYFAADYFDNTLTVRLNSGGDMRFADGIVLVIRDVENTALEKQGIEQEIELEPSLTEGGPDGGMPTTAVDSPARVTLYLNKTCPDEFPAFSDGAGSLTMDSIYVPGEQERIKGSFKLKFVDSRYSESADDPAPSAELQGEFDFDYLSGMSPQAIR